MRPSTRTTVLFLAIACLGLTLADTAAAQVKAVDKRVDFALDTWVPLDLADGPVTLHRLRIVKRTGPITKSKLIRPFSSEYLEEIQVQLEYSNSATRDWEADLSIEWLDNEGRVIDGYRDEEGLNDRESHDITTITVPTLKYGLTVARTLSLKVTVRPD